MSLTPKEVHDASFHKTPIGKRGYNCTEVDQFLARAERALAGEERMTPVEIEKVSFGKQRIGSRGYDEQEVDNFLDVLESELAARIADGSIVPRQRGPRD
jgi:DivIVA domain-containing protein